MVDGGAAGPSLGWVSFLSDYGLDDAFVGVCRGVIARIAPTARVIDVCHQIAPQDVSQAATVFATAVPYLPVGVHLVTVDPPNRSKRDVVVRSEDGALLVGPDNGVMSLGWAALGGPAQAWQITNEDLLLSTPGRTFRGRDVFAPVAAHLVSGVDPALVGPPVGVESLARLTLREAVVDDDHVHAEVRNVDHFGNLSLNLARSDLEAAGIALGDLVELRCGGRSMQIPFALSYAEVPAGRLTLCEDTFRAVMLAVNLGSAGRLLRAGRGTAVVISRLPAVGVR